MFKECDENIPLVSGLLPSWSSSSFVDKHSIDSQVHRWNSKPTSDHEGQERSTGSCTKLKSTQMPPRYRQQLLKFCPNRNRLVTLSYPGYITFSHLAPASSFPSIVCPHCFTLWLIFLLLTFNLCTNGFGLQYNQLMPLCIRTGVIKVIHH